MQVHDSRSGQPAHRDRRIDAGKRVAIERGAHGRGGGKQEERERAKTGEKARHGGRMEIPNPSVTP